MNPSVMSRLPRSSASASADGPTTIVDSRSSIRAGPDMHVPADSRRILHPVDRQQDLFQDGFDVQLAPGAGLRAVFDPLSDRLIGVAQHDFHVKFHRPSPIRPFRGALVEERGNAFRRVVRLHQIFQV